jgi:hypothetical protein
MSGGSSRSSSCGSWTSQARRDAAVELSIEEARIALLHDHVALLEKDAPEVAALEAAVVEAKEAKRLAQMRGEDEAYALRGASRDAEPPLVSWDARTEPERLLLGSVWDLETAIKS